VDQASYLALRRKVRAYVAKKPYACLLDDDAIQDSISAGVTGILSDLQPFEASEIAYRASLAVLMEIQQKRYDHRISEELDRSTEWPVPPRLRSTWLNQLPVAFVRTLPQAQRTAVGLLRDGMTQAEAARVTGHEVAGYLGTDLHDAYEKWQEREEYQLTEADQARLQASWIEPLKLLLKGQPHDLVRLKLGLKAQRLWDIQKKAIRKLPHLRQYLGRWNRG
jgi:hypothetical protein